MAQRVSAREGAIVGFSLGTADSTRRGARALKRITVAAGHDAGAADDAAALLEGVALVLAERRAEASLPGQEQGAWTALGATFDDPAVVARGKVRTIAAFQGLLRSGVSGDAAAAALLDVDRSRVSQRLGERSMYAVVVGDERFFPGWQFSGNKVLPGLRKVLAVLDPGLHPLSVAHWFTTPSPELDAIGTALSPADWLATGGDVGTAAELAAQV